MYIFLLNSQDNDNNYLLFCIENDLLFTVKNVLMNTCKLQGELPTLLYNKTENKQFIIYSVPQKQRRSEFSPASLKHRLLLLNKTTEKEYFISVRISSIALICA